MKTKEYWEGWYKGLSKAFLEVPVIKQLVLAESDKTDKELKLGQIEAKFKLDIIMNSGHVVQEDQPKALANILRFSVKFSNISHKADSKEVIKSLARGEVSTVHI